MVILSSRLPLLPATVYTCGPSNTMKTPCLSFLVASHRIRENSTRGYAHPMTRTMKVSHAPRKKAEIGSSSFSVDLTSELYFFLSCSRKIFPLQLNSSCYAPQILTSRPTMILQVVGVSLLGHTIFFLTRRDRRVVALAWKHLRLAFDLGYGRGVGPFIRDLFLAGVRVTRASKPSVPFFTVLSLMVLFFVLIF